MAWTLIEDLENAATLALNDENWPNIKQHISLSASDAQMFHDELGYKIHQGDHDRLVGRAVAMPAELEGHIESLQNEWQICLRIGQNQRQRGRP